MNKILVCPPDYYDVNYEINPWMHVREKPDTPLAHSQWEAFYKLLVELKIEVEQIKPQKGLPDMVFTANGGFVYGDKFIVSNFRYPQRQEEAKLFSNWFEKEDYEIIHLPEDSFFEGEGDAFIMIDTLIAGFRFRSDIRSHNFVGEITGKRALSLELASPDFYHLDTCFCPLNEDSALYYPDAFDKYGQKALKHLIPNLIPVGKKDAMNFCCNAVVRGKDIIMNLCTDKLKKELEALGYSIHPLKFSEFIKAGGSAKCLTLYLDQHPEMRS